MDRQPGQERLDIGRAQARREALAVEDDKALNPGAIRLLGADTVMLDPDPVAARSSSRTGGIAAIKQYVSAPESQTRAVILRNFPAAFHRSFGRFATAMTAESPGSDAAYSSHTSRKAAGWAPSAPRRIIPRVKVSEILRLLSDDGWVIVATRGSHRQFKHPSKLGRVTVPGKPSDELAPGTLNSIRKQAGFKK
jgi:predicted RNA binding protein YcfA (HicA-like mRNA interferase family)